MPEEARFIVDTMLGTLAKWLRVLGFDTIYQAGMEDDEILRIAGSDNRVILSRDRELCNRKAGSQYIESTHLDAQVSQVLHFYISDGNKILSRCLECNSQLGVVPRGEVPKTSVPEGLWGRYPEFWHCENCDSYYWPGTHYENMREKARDLLQKAY